MTNITQTLRTKIDKLAAGKFSPQANYEFFGQLTKQEIVDLKSFLQKHSIPDIPPEAQALLLQYLQRLENKITAQNKNHPSG
ncbi:hypothetical protein D6821_02605 [Candidatus Parcubacteria bacterium]|nr:MAG: hypothetical protein D6821_02605 [Candidatus Parcubacteria bacterium]